MVARAEGAAHVRLAALVLAACWTAPAPVAAPATPPPAVTAPPACPASFAAARGDCSTQRPCEYPQGTCRCAVDTSTHECRGGAAVRVEPSAIPQPPPPPPPPTIWQCTPAVRPDGCPGTDPSGRACSDEGKTCRYGECCFQDITCQHGTWAMTGGGCPP